MNPQTQPGPGTDEPPSPEELMALIELLQQQGLNKDQIPPDLQTLLDNVKRQKAAKGGPAAPPEAPTEEITPNPGFVIKTAEVASGSKVFINVCSSDRVAAPGGWSDGVMPDEVAAALEKLQSAAGDTAAAGMTPGEVEALRFPLACGPPQVDSDRKGAPCTVVDVVFNADVVRAAAAERRLKAMLIEVSLGWVAKKLGAELDPRYKLPRMRYKGEVVASQRIRADDKRRKLVTELRDVDEEPSFALRTTKPPTATETVAAAAPKASAAGKWAAGAATAAQLGAATSTPSKGSAAAAAAASTPAAAAALAPSGPPYEVEYEGRPVDWIRVTLDLPGPSADPPAVEVSGRTLFVRFSGQAEVQVPLLFAASADGSTATCEPAEAVSSAAGLRHKLVVRLPYRSLEDYMADARAQAPLAFGQLNFASKALLELEP